MQSKKDTIYDSKEEETRAINVVRKEYFKARESLLDQTSKYLTNCHQPPINNYSCLFCPKKQKNTYIFSFLLSQNCHTPTESRAF